MSAHSYRDYGFESAGRNAANEVILPSLLSFADDLKVGTRVLDVGCGNGFICGEFLKRGCRVVGIDLGKKGIDIARKSYPLGRFEILAADEKIINSLDEPAFDLVVSTEVVEHLYSPREYAQGCFLALKPGGRFICTTPYHGYLKNLILSLLGKWDTHANPLWDGGHIKLWSRATLTSLLKEAGFTNIQFRGAGRLPYIWMSMVISADRP